ncbi:rRNA processing/ribosome biogenesis-domain-containing protein [Aspergillus similis]
MAHLYLTLRAVNHRLTTVPVQKLPAIAASLAASITECGELLSAPQSQKAGKSDLDHSVQVHKLVTRVSSLLQDRSFEGRWAAVVLVKALVEAGQWEIIRGSEPFVRGLMSILSKSDPVSTKTMAVIALTRIFHLTYQYPTLVREITTPSLPGFITTTLNLISVKPTSEPSRRLKPNTPFLEVILRSYAELIARHPTIFRPFTAQIHSLLQTIVGSTSASYSQSVVDVAQQLFIALHHCAPKNTGGEEWKSACRMTINSIHTTGNHVLRAIVEQWESVDPALRQQLSNPIDYALEVGSHKTDALGLSGWQGLDAGVERLLSLLRMLSTFLATATASTVSIPVGPILDLTARFMSVVVPSDAGDVQANRQVSRTEREALLAELPRIHVACIRILRVLISTLETAALPIAQTILEQTLWVFRAEKFNKKIRTSVYDLLGALIKHIGPSMNKKNVASLTDMVRTCCFDILPQVGENGTKDTSPVAKGKSKPNSAAVNADFFLNPSLKQGRETNSTTRPPRLVRAASKLLQIVLSHIALEYLAPPIRAEIDRTIIMTSDKDAMYASVLNPHPAVKGRGATISIIPFLARSCTSEMNMEALIRPRLPVLTHSSYTGHYVNIEEDDDEEMEHVVVPEPIQAEDPVVSLKPAATPNLRDLMDSSAPQSFTASVNKRTYTEESSQNSTPSASFPAMANNLQPKKARFDSSVSTSPASTVAQPSAFTGTLTSATAPSSSVQPAATQTSSVMETSTVSAGITTNTTSVVVEQSSTLPRVETVAMPEEADSDEEMPTLNIEPDTDEEDEE